MNFLHNLVPLHLHLANNKTTEQLLQGLHYHKFVVGLEVFLDCGELFPSLILLGLCLAFWSLEEWFQLILYFNYGLKCIPNVLYGHLLLKKMLDVKDVNQLFLIVPLAKGGHLEISPIGQLDLDLLGVYLLV